MSNISKTIVIATVILAIGLSISVGVTGLARAQSAANFGHTVAEQAQQGDFGKNTVSPAAQGEGLKAYNGCQASGDGLKHC